MNLRECRDILMHMISALINANISEQNKKPFEVTWSGGTTALDPREIFGLISSRGYMTEEDYKWMGFVPEKLPDLKLNQDVWIMRYDIYFVNPFNGLQTCVDRVDCESQKDHETLEERMNLGLDYSEQFHNFMVEHFGKEMKELEAEGKAVNYALKRRLIKVIPKSYDRLEKEGFFGQFVHVMEKHCYNCQFSEGIEGKNETIGCEKDKRLHSAEDGCENHIFREEQNLRSQAEWLPRDLSDKDCNVYYCSSCKMDISAAEALYYKYCPECGSEMKLLSLDLNRDAEEIDKIEDKEKDE